jgi:hypothetical protein
LEAAPGVIEGVEGDAEPAHLLAGPSLFIFQRGHLAAMGIGILLLYRYRIPTNSQCGSGVAHWAPQVKRDIPREFANPGLTKGSDLARPTIAATSLIVT